MQVRCPYCQATVDAPASKQYTCAKCKAIFRVELPAADGAAASAPATGGPAPLAGAAAPAPAASVPPGTRCALHGDRDATGACANCTTPVCPLCALPGEGGVFCPNCADVAPLAHGPTTPTPWERRAELGLVAAVAETIRAVMTEPAAFFARMPRDAGIGAPAGIYALVTFVASLPGLLIILALPQNVIPQLPPGQHLPPGLDAFFTPEFIRMWVGASIFIGPPMGIVMTLIAAAIIHAGLYLFGGAKHGFETTARTVLYAQTIMAAAVVFAPFVLVPQSAQPIAGILGAVSAVGQTALVVWLICTAIVGLRETQETSTGTAAAAVLVPLGAAFCCLMFGVGAAIALAVRAQHG